MLKDESKTAFKGDMLNEIKKVLNQPLFQFIAAATFAYVIFFARCPVNFILPTLYGEDGLWSTHIFRFGFWDAVMKIRTDYYVFGNLVMLWLGMQVCDLFYGGDILLLAKSYAIISMAFYAVTVSLPFILIRHILPFRYLVVLWLLLCFVPLGLSDTSGYEIIGRINNTGFPFLFIGFILVLQRNRTGSKSFSVFLCDIGLAVCSATNPFCLLYVPVVAWPYLKVLKEIIRKEKSVEPRNMVSMVMLVILSGFIALKPIMVSPVKIMGPTRELTLPITIEMGAARNIIYPAIYPYYKSMSNASAMVILILAVVVIAGFSNRRHTSVYALASLMFLLTSVFLIISRPTLRIHMEDYTSTYPDRYYFAQNMVGIFVLVLFTYDLEGRIKNKLMKFIPVLLLLVYSFLPVCKKSPATLSPTMFIPLDEQGLFSDLVIQAYNNYSYKVHKGDPEKIVYILIDCYPPGQGWVLKVPIEMVRKAVRVEHEIKLVKLNPSSISI